MCSYFENPVRGAKATPYQLLFTVMSYNILAQELLESHLYLYDKHESSALKWGHRKEILLSEIREANADVRIDPLHTRRFSDFSHMPL
jgi:protein angel